MSACLKEHHGGDCSTCEGSGRNIDDIEDEALYERAANGDAEALAQAPECSRCEGSGTILWHWSHEEDGVCDWCRYEARARRPGVPVCEWGEEGEQLVCLPCARAAHARICGCDAEGWGGDTIRETQGARDVEIVLPSGDAPALVPGVVVGRPETYPAEGEPVGGES